MDKKWLVWLCLGVSACTPLTSPSNEVARPNNYPTGGSFGQIQPASPVTIRNGWLVYAPTEPNSVKEILGSADAGKREVYYGRISQILQNRDPIREAKNFRARHGYVFLKNKAFPDKLYGEAPVAGDSESMNKLMRDYSGLYRCPVWQNAEAEAKKICPKSSSLFLQGTEKMLDGFVDIDYQSKLNEQISGQTGRYGVDWNATMYALCMDEVANKLCPDPEKYPLTNNSKVRFDY